MWKRTTLLLAAMLMPALVSCTESPRKVQDDLIEGDVTPPVEYPEDKEELGPFGLAEAEVTAERVEGGVLARFVISNNGAEAVDAKLYAELAIVGGSAPSLASPVQTVTMTSGKVTSEALLLSISGGKLPSVEDEPRYVLKWRLETPLGPLTGSRGLPLVLQHRDLSLMVPATVVPGQPLPIRVRLGRVGDWSPIANVGVRVRATGPGVDETLTLVTDERGQAEAEVVPSGEGNVSVTASDSQGGYDLVEGNVAVERRSSILLTTDKPIYQPGQFVHMRVLALDRFSRSPLANRPVLVEGFDGNNNRIYKVVLESDAFGVASTTMEIGSQVSLGVWRLRASVDEDVTEKTIKVDRYALPRFKIEAERDKPWYKPGQTAAFDISARYFFGKPVEGNMTLELFRYVGQWELYSSTESQLNSEGIAALEVELPDYVAGTPFDGAQEGEVGQASVLVQLTISDLAGHTEKQSFSVPVVLSEYSLTVIPESGSMVSGVENQVYVFLTNPAGDSVGGTVEVACQPTSSYTGPYNVEMPASGPLILSLAQPASESGCLSLVVTKRASSGAVVFTRSRQLCASEQSNLLLRTDRALYQVGEEILLDVFASDGIGDAFLDVVRAGQTVVTITVPMEQGRGTAILDLDGSMTGELELHVYRLQSDGFMGRDSRLVAVIDNSELTVQAVLDKETYEPGDTATVQFTVKDGDSSPAVAALGVQVVDEAVFALAESQPGLAKLYFLLEEAILQAKASFAPGQQSFGELSQKASQQDPDSPEAVAAQQVAQALLATKGDLASGNSVATIWHEGEQQPAYRWVESAVVDLMQQNVVAAFQSVELDCNSQTLPLEEGFEKISFIDPWGNPIRKELGEEYGNAHFELVSLGMDEVESDDDISLSVKEWQLRDLLNCYRQRPDSSQWDDVWAVADASTGWQDVGGWADSAWEGDSTQGTQGPAGIRVRQWFPETLFVAPSVITDQNGKASISFPIADSITQWRMNTLASTTTGLLGSRTDSFIVFQDFFIDIDLPKYLVRGDEITFPILIYNYLSEPQTVEINLEPQEWFTLLGTSSAVKELEAGEVTSVHFAVRVNEVGWHSVTVSGQGSAMSDAVMRSVEVKPDGAEVAATTTGTLVGLSEAPEDHAQVKVQFPDDAVPGSPRALVSVSSGVPSAVATQGLDAMLQMPTGCFEQTTATAWPNVLILKYLQAAQQSSPELEMKAVSLINTGYQRILTFETEQGGFNWWEGDKFGNTILSAIAIQMLTDTREVHDAVELAVVNRTSQFLEQTNRWDGSWAEVPELHAGNEGLGASALRTTCYVNWSLAYGGFKNSPAMEKSTGFIEQHLPSEQDPYTIALCANALAASQPSSANLPPAIDKLVALVVESDNGASWSTSGDTWCGSMGSSASVELTALATLALVATNSRPDLVVKAGTWLAEARDPNGGWGSYNTQATVLALKALLVAGSQNVEVNGTVEVLVNGASVAARQFNEFNKDVVWQVELGDELAGDNNLVELHLEGSGMLQWQVAQKHHIPWGPVVPGPGPLSVEVSMDTTTVQVDDLVHIKVTVSNTDPFNVGKNVMVIVGIPAGFAPVTQDLGLLKEQGLIQAFEVTGREVLLYIQSLEVDAPLELEFAMLATMPVKASGAEAEVYMYYDKETSAQAPPVMFEAY